MSTTQAELARFQRDIDFYREQYEKLLQDHPDQWVAIYNQAVVGTAATHAELLSYLKQHGIPPNLALIEYMTCDDSVLIV